MEPKIHIQQVKNGFLVSVPGKALGGLRGNLPSEYYELNQFVFDNWIDAATFCGRWFEQQKEQGEHLQ